MFGEWEDVHFMEKFNTNLGMYVISTHFTLTYSGRCINIVIKSKFEYRFTSARKADFSRLSVDYFNA